MDMRDFTGRFEDEYGVMDDDFLVDNMVYDYEVDNSVYRDENCGCEVDSTSNIGKIPDENEIMSEFMERSTVGYPEDTPDPNLYSPEALYEKEHN